jgi:hypothetical protein
MSFSRNRSPISHSYSIDSSLVDRSTIIKGLGIFFSPTLSFEFHIYNMICRALKILGFIKRNTTNFSSSYCHRVLYSSLVFFIMEYSVVVWHPHLFYDVLRMARVQIRFLSYAAILLNHPQRDYSLICSTLLLPSLDPHRIKANHSFNHPFLMAPLSHLISYPQFPSVF